MPLSAVLITRDAAARLAECLASVAFCDEIVVVDSGSADDTMVIARSAGARVIEHAWEGFGPQKRFAVSQAAHDWVLCIDADERVDAALRDSITRELHAPRASAYEVARCNRFLGRWLRHGEGYPDWSLRLFDRRAAQWSLDSVHEKVETVTNVARLTGDLLHDSADSLERYLDKQNHYTSLQAQNLLSHGRKASALDLVFSPLARFAKFYVLRLGFLDGVAGLVHVCIGCMNSFNKYAKLMALQKALD
jgi:glycosyltransferase involved in cell wall biosynthesis